MRANHASMQFYFHTIQFHFMNEAIFCCLKMKLFLTFWVITVAISNIFLKLLPLEYLKNSPRKYLKIFSNDLRIVRLNSGHYAKKYYFRIYLKPGQNKKGQNVFQLHRFLNTFSQLQAVKSIQKTVQLENFLALLILTWL